MRAYTLAVTLYPYSCLVEDRRQHRTFIPKVRLRKRYLWALGRLANG
jgi:hypothetical protein